MITLLDVLEERGWTIVRREPGSIDLGTVVSQRYPHLAEDYVEFVSAFDECWSEKHQMWFLSAADFRGESDKAFKWDEWERMSLDSAEGDADLIEQIRSFWDQHIPILHSVGSGQYEYLALRLSGENAGAVVHGFEPEFEQADIVCPSIGNVEALATAVRDLEKLAEP